MVNLDLELEEFIDSLGLKYFRGYELTPLWHRIEKGVRNSPPPKALWPNIVPTLIVLDYLRDEMGSSIIITSAYRNLRYNEAVGGGKYSTHCKFAAIDFMSPSGTPRSWSSRLFLYRGKSFSHKGSTFVFHGGIGVYNSFVHLDTRGYDASW